jgi:hypothetical protein
MPTVRAAVSHHQYPMLLTTARFSKGLAENSFSVLTAGNANWDQHQLEFVKKKLQSGTHIKWK